MKLSPLSLLCLSLILFHAHSSPPKRGGISFGKGFRTNKLPTRNRGNTKSKNNQGFLTKVGYPKQSGHNPFQSGRPAYPSWQQGGVGYPAHGSPYGRGYRGYPGGYVNQNPNNKILSPHYGGSFGYGGYGLGGGSPFSRSVEAMGVYPQEQSKGFGRSAAMAAGGGAMAGMALGYGLGRFPRPHFPFHSPQEEYYYNHYMYMKYGVRSTDTNDYGRDYSYGTVPEIFYIIMRACMKRADVLPVENPKPKLNPAANSTTAASSTVTTTATPAVVTAAPDTVRDTNTSDTNSSAAANSSTPLPSTPHAPHQPEDLPEPPASQAVSEEEEDDTVSIMEIGYPALIRQLKARKCLEEYMIFSDLYLKRETGGAEGLEMGYLGFFRVAFSALLALWNGNMLMLLH